MTNNLFELIQNKEVSIRLEISSLDLMSFSMDLINRTKQELVVQKEEKEQEQYLTKEETKAIFGVCSVTLWHWNKDGYLKNIKVGNKLRYKMSDVKKILEGSEKSK